MWEGTGAVCQMSTLESSDSSRVVTCYSTLLTDFTLTHTPLRPAKTDLSPVRGAGYELVMPLAFA
jgi:hypothetical protein